MKIMGLDGKSYLWSLAKYTKPNDRLVSGPHKTARGLLRLIYPSDKILEEVHIPGAMTSLYLDFFLPTRKLVVEVHGAQHYEYISHYHGSKKEFLKSQGRDRDKIEWSSLNNFRFVELPQGSEATWKELIINGESKGKDK